jgi:hypothetical protein
VAVNPCRRPWRRRDAPAPLSPLVGADPEMPHEPSRLLVAGDLHADESWFENLVY